GNDYARVGPARDAVPGGADPRRNVGEGAVSTLRIANVGAELVREGGEVGIERRRAPEDFGIAHPAQALVALRAIGGHAQKVSALAPKDIAPQLVHGFVGGLELNRERRAGIEHDTFNRISRWRSRIARQLNIAESVKSEMGFERFTSLSAQNVSVGGFGR